VKWPNSALSGEREPYRSTTRRYIVGSLVRSDLFSSRPPDGGGQMAGKGDARTGAVSYQLQRGIWVRTSSYNGNFTVQITFWSLYFLFLFCCSYKKMKQSLFTSLSYRCYLVTGKCTGDCGGRSEVNFMSIEILFRIFEVTTAKTAKTWAVRT